ncbi:MAG: hypothetical protein Q4D04_15590, partial [Clostridia bacterium]|nr:hypothetical protein [Clostridia bacterium]
LSSWLYLMKENPYEDATTEKDPMAEFMLTLRRQPIPKSEAMQNGIDFENLVTDIVNGTYKPEIKYGRANKATGEATEYKKFHPWYDAARQIADIISGAVLQASFSKHIEVNQCGDYLLYGRLDALKAGTIFDIKFSKDYDVGKYRESTQHPVYFTLVPEACEFTYLISNGSLVWTETYRRYETDAIEPVIGMFNEWLTAQGLDEEYRAHWLAR